MSNQILLVPLLVLVQTASAQSTDSSLTELNSLFNGAVQVKVDRRQQLVFDLYDGTGRFRQDIVAIADIEPNEIHYSPEEDAVIMTCKTGKPQCITKELFKLNTIRLNGRSNLPRPAADPEGMQSIAALKDLIRRAGEQLATATDETPHRTKRMK